MMYKLNKTLPSDYNRALEKGRFLRRINAACQKAVNICDGKYEPIHHEHLQAHEALEMLGYCTQYEGPHLPVPLEMLANQDTPLNAKVFVRTVGFCTHLGDQVLLCPINTESSREEASGSGCGAWKSVRLEVEDGEAPPHGEAVHVFGSLCPKGKNPGHWLRMVRARLWEKVTLKEAGRIQEMLRWHPAHALRLGRVPQRYLDRRVDRVPRGAAAGSSTECAAKTEDEKEEKEVPYLPVPIEHLVSMEHLAQDRTLVRTVGFCIYSYGKPFLCSLEAETASKVGSFARDADGAVGPWHSLPLAVPKRARRSLLPRQLCFTHRIPLQVWGAVCLDRNERLVVRVNMWAKPSLKCALKMQKQLEDDFETLRNT